jgi:hypothetical protein
MYKKETGIVLKRFIPLKQKLSILTDLFGKILVIAQPNNPICQRLWPGSMISANFEQLENSTYLARGIEIINVPEAMTQSDIYWLHHILELHYYFIPYCQPSLDALSYLQFYIYLLNRKKLFKDRFDVLKKICVMHFLNRTGFFFNENLLKCSIFLDKNITLFHDETMKEMPDKLLDYLDEIYIKNVINMDECIVRCLRTHPCYRFFKTIKFIYKNCLFRGKPC